MKNKFKTLISIPIFLILLVSNTFSNEQFNFDITEIEITDKEINLKVQKEVQ